MRSLSTRMDMNTAGSTSRTFPKSRAILPGYDDPSRHSLEPKSQLHGSQAVKMSARSRIRCAIYTRKSSEEGLEQSFNSLHAQREPAKHISRASAMKDGMSSQPSTMQIHHGCGVRVVPSQTRRLGHELIAPPAMGRGRGVPSSSTHLLPTERTGHANARTPERLCCSQLRR